MPRAQAAVIIPYHGGERIGDCAICGRLKDVETSFSKYLAPQFDRPLPAEAGQLVVLPGLAAAGDDRQVRRCPSCGALYDLLRYSEYHMNGAEDSEELRRMSAAGAADFARGQAWQLEALRREIDDLQDAAGALGDYIDRGRPAGEEGRSAYAAMQEKREAAAVRLQVLADRVEALRSVCPEIIAAWADAHSRVCRSLLATLPQRSEDEQTARFVVRSWLESWERLPAGGDAFISASSPWLPGYRDRLERELAPGS